MEKVTTHAGLDVHKERIVIATLKGQAREPTTLDIPNDPRRSGPGVPGDPDREFRHSSERPPYGP